MMLFKVIERIKDNDMIPVYERVRDAGRSLSEGPKHLDSWIEPNFGRCLEPMECVDLRLLSVQTREVVAPYLDED